MTGTRFRLFAAVTTGLVVVGAVAFLLFVTFRPEEVVEEPFVPRESHENYREALNRLEIADSEMGSRWITAADEVLETAVTVTPPVEEVVFFDPRDPTALGYRFAVTRGRQIDISLKAEHDRYFADVFRLEEDDTADAGAAGAVSWSLDEHVASRPEGDNRIVFEARGNNYYLLRIQPELLRGGRVTVSIVESAPLAFPVEGHGPGDIWSYFGDGRDGGARIHHGIDIFAPRGTPVLAVSDGEITRVGQRDRGGNVVVLRDDARDTLVYYAHLDRQLVENGVRVRAGDVVGTVGNTGNAITTPPHLHIGLYQGSWRRPIDPWPYVVGPAVSDPPAVAARPETTGRWFAPDGPVTISDTFGGSGASSAGRGGRQVPRNRNPFLRGAGDTFVGAVAEPENAPITAAPAEMPLDGGTPLRIVGIMGDAARVRSVTGEVGVIPLSILGRYTDLSDADRSGEGRLDRDRSGEGRSGADGPKIPLTGEQQIRDVLSGDEIPPNAAGTAATHIADVSGRPLVVLPSGDLAILGERP